MVEKTGQIGVRLKSGDLRLLRRICESRGEDVSDFVRRSIRKEMAKLGFLTSADMQALGVVKPGKNHLGGEKANE